MEDTAIFQLIDSLDGLKNTSNYMSDSAFILTEEPTSGETLVCEIINTCISVRKSFSIYEYYEGINFPSLIINDVNYNPDEDEYLILYFNDKSKIKKHDFIREGNQKLWKSINLVFDDSKCLLTFCFYYLQQNNNRKVSNVFDTVFSLHELQKFERVEDYYEWAYQRPDNNLKF